MSDEYTYIIEVEASEGNFFKEITQKTVDKIMKIDDGEEVYELIIDGEDVPIYKTSDIDLYFGYPEQWEEQVKSDWKRYLE